MAACLLAVRVGVILAGRHSWAAASAQQAGQRSTDGLWADVDESSLSVKGQREVVPTAYRTLRLNRDVLRGLIEQAPLAFTERLSARQLS